MLRTNQSETTPVTNDTVQLLIVELKTKLGSDPDLTFTKNQVATILGRKLSKSEQNQWTKNRNLVAREKARQISLTKKSAQRQKQEEKRNAYRTEQTRIELNLLNLSNAELIQKMKKLHALKGTTKFSQKEPKRAVGSFTDQLIRALSMHTIAELKTILLQIETQFSQKEKNQIKEELEILMSSLRASESIKRSSKLLTELTQEELVTDLLYNFTPDHYSDFPTLGHGLFGRSLENIPTLPELTILEKSIQALPVTHGLTQEIKTTALTLIKIEKMRRSLLPASAENRRSYAQRFNQNLAQIEQNQFTQTDLLHLR